MNTLLRALAIATVASLFIVSAAVAAPPDKDGGGKSNGDRTSDVTDTDECYYEDGSLAGTAALDGTTNLWPPNHKYTQSVVEWQTIDREDSFTGMYDATHNQFDEEGNELNGAGNTDDDIVDDAGNTGVLMSENGTQTVTYSIRAERSGRDQDGRTYSITGSWTIMDDDGQPPADCTFEFYIYVPHDQGNRNNGDANPDQDAPADGSLITLF